MEYNSLQSVSSTQKAHAEHSVKIQLVSNSEKKLQVTPTGTEKCNWLNKLSPSLSLEEGNTNQAKLHD